MAEPPTAEASVGPDEGRYRVRSRVEIAFILRSIMKAGALVTANFGVSNQFVVTAILEVDPDEEQVLVDSGSNPELNQRLLQSARLAFVTALDGVTVKFETGEAESTTFNGRLAFAIPFPTTVLKLQRREYFRVETPLTNPLKCRIGLADRNFTELTIADISLGGICLLGEHEQLKLEFGTRFDKCRIALPDIGLITADLTVRNSFSLTLKSGAVTRRTGCSFGSLGTNQESLVQRYINKLERDRRATQPDKS